MTTKIDLKILRKQFGMSQDALAQRAGLSRSTIVKIENGVREVTHPEIQTFREIFQLANQIGDAHIAPDEKITIPQKNVEKFKEVFLYILEKTAGKSNVGLTVLYKLLYFTDFDYFEKYEEQMMGLTYLKYERGPVPKEFPAILEDMKESRDIEEHKSKHYDFEQKKYIPLRRADLSKISAQEIQMIDSVLGRYSDLSARDISSLSHEDMPWAATPRNGDAIKYEFVSYRNEKFSVSEYEEL